MSADSYYLPADLKRQLAMAKGARGQADKSLKYAVMVHADRVKELVRLDGAEVGHFRGFGAVQKSREVMERACRRLEAAEALVAAIEEEMKWA